MFDEETFSGFCRTCDESRRVFCEAENGQIQADCLYPDCAFADSCTIAQQISVWAGSLPSPKGSD